MKRYLVGRVNQAVLVSALWWVSIGAGMLQVGVVRAGTLNMVTPAFNFATNTGYLSSDYSVSLVNASGTATTEARKITSGKWTASSPIRWASNGATVELANIQTLNIQVSPGVYLHGMNNLGSVIGYSHYSENVSGGGYTAVRWDAGQTSPTVLGNLGVDSTGSMQSEAKAINDANVTVGYSTKFIGAINIGYRAVRWDSGSAAITELGNLGSGNTGGISSMAYAINNSGVIVGYSTKPSLGERAVRWDAGSTNAVELGILSANSRGVSMSEANAINDAGTIAGYCKKYINNVDVGEFAVRWDAGQTGATELGNLGVDSSGNSYSSAQFINREGTIVGKTIKYNNAISLGMRAVRWDAGSAMAVELSNLGTDKQGVTQTVATGINNAGIIGGYASIYNNGVFSDSHAVVWLSDASILDLNSLNILSVPPGGVWTLNAVTSISDNGWISGFGKFDPDGPGPLYNKGFNWTAQLGLGGNWLNTSNSNNTWGKGVNWSTGTPAIQRDAVFNVNATYTVAFDADQLCRKVYLSAGDTTLALGSHLLTVEQGLSIANGASLTANGHLNSDVVNNGILTVSKILGTMTINGSYNQTGELDLDILSDSEAAKLIINGTVDLKGTIRVVFKNGYAPSKLGTYDLLDSTGTLYNNGIVFDFSQAPLSEGLFWDTSNFLIDGTVSIVPEPASFSLMLIGGIGLSFKRRSMRRWSS